MKIFAAFVLFVSCLFPCRADSIKHEIAEYLTDNSALPLAPGIAVDLAGNLLDAQKDSSYAAMEPDSLTLSVGSVLRAISLDVFPGGPSEVVNPQENPIVFAQSNIAIDDRVSIEFFVNGVPYIPGEVINFGTVPVQTPEAPTGGLLLLGLLALPVAGYLRRHFATHLRSLWGLS